MAVSTKAFHWLSTIEKEIDNALVDFDLLTNNCDIFEEDEIDMFHNKISNLSSLYAQLVHKAQTIFENSAKLEATNINLKKELEEALTRSDLYKNEIDGLVKQIHCTQLKSYNLNSSDEDSELILNKLYKEMEERLMIQKPTANLENANRILEHENKDLKEYILALQSELYGARLAARYLDKELAGRIQQIQLLSRKMDGDKYDRMWSTLESEISIQRHKTVIKAVKGPPSNIPKEGSSNCDPPREIYNIIREVRLLKPLHASIGMSVTGGHEHGVPLLISELYPGQPADLSGQLFVGDALLSINRQNLRNLRHTEAVRLLSQQMEQMNLEVMYIDYKDADDDTNCNGENTRENNDIHVNENGYMYRLYSHPSIRKDNAVQCNASQPKVQFNIDNKSQSPNNQ